MRGGPTNLFTLCKGYKQFRHNSQAAFHHLWYCNAKVGLGAVNENPCINPCKYMYIVQNV